MVLSIIFLEDKHKILLHLTIFYEYQLFFQHRICFSIQPQLQLVNLHRNRRHFVIKLHTWFLSIIFLEDKYKILLHLSIFYEYQQFFQHRICFSIQPPDYSDPWFSEMQLWNFEKFPEMKCSLKNIFTKIT
jgi:hypothetical protein